MAINDYNYVDGFGASSGDSMVLRKPWYSEGVAYYLSSVIGNDGAAGTERLRPLATLAAAITAASDGDFIIVAADHDETLTAVQDIDTKVTIVAEGASGGNPTAKFTLNHASAIMFTVTVTNVEIRNILFPTKTVANSAALVSSGAGDFLLKGCRFEHTATDTGYAVDLTASDRTYIENCQFVVTATTGTSPKGAITVTDVALDRLEIRDTIFDNGTQSFEDGLAVVASASTISNLHIERASLLRGADMTLTSASTGRINISTSTGGGKVKFV